MESGQFSFGRTSQLTTAAWQLERRSRDTNSKKLNTVNQSNGAIDRAECQLRSSQS